MYLSTILSSVPLVVDDTICTALIEEEEEVVEEEEACVGGVWSLALLRNKKADARRMVNVRLTFWISLDTLSATEAEED